MRVRPHIKSQSSHKQWKCLREKGQKGELASCGDGGSVREGEGVPEMDGGRDCTPM